MTMPIVASGYFVNVLKKDKGFGIQAI